MPSVMVSKVPAPGGVAAGLATKSPVTGALVGSALNQVGDTINRQNQLNYAASNTLSQVTGMGNRMSGGYDMSLAKISWDGGEWPFVGYYGLLINVDDAELTLGHSATPGRDSNAVEVGK